MPIYTIVVALYDEASAVPGLVAALRELDYPAEKLQVIFVLEPDDTATREALLQLDPGAPFEILIAPDLGPRTKPKALNAALALARGTFIAVFDAEDRPARDQLHRALDAFLGNGPDIACVQARLTIDNTRDSWLARLFTAEYAGLFDVLLPGLAQLRLPLPLGGSSNHFRTAALRDDRRLGPLQRHRRRRPRHAARAAWLPRRGHRLDHLRGGARPREALDPPAHPLVQGLDADLAGAHALIQCALARELGFSGFLAFQLVVGGTVLSALVHPVFIACCGLFGCDGPAVRYGAEAPSGQRCSGCIWARSFPATSPPRRSA